jgi:hypothetical protein
MRLTEQALRASMAVCAKALDGNMADYLQGPAIRPVFRQFN